MDHAGLEEAALVGWSDGACTALILADQQPDRVCGVFFFACNMDPSGTKEFKMTPVIDRCFSRHRKDYQALSATPDQFEAFVADVVEDDGDGAELYGRTTGRNQGAGFHRARRT